MCSAESAVEKGVTVQWARTGKSPQDSTGCQLTARRRQCHISLTALAKVNTSVTLAASQVISSKSHFPQCALNERAQHTVTEGNIEISRLTFAVLPIYLFIYLSIKPWKVIGQTFCLAHSNLTNQFFLVW